MDPINCDYEVKEIIENHHVYGAECVLNALVRACKDESYLGLSSLLTLIVGAYEREATREEGE